MLLPVSSYQNRTREISPFHPAVLAAKLPASRLLSLALAVATLGTGMLAGCDQTKPSAKAVEPIVRDVPAILRGTIGSETSIRGIEPVLVSGYGIVVGLNATGGGPYPESIAATMERELARGGIGRGGTLSEGPLAGKTPRQVLADKNVTVVIVEGVVAAGAPRESVFDVRVRSLPGSSLSSLESGVLWTTELRIGPVTPMGSMRTRKMAEARGPVFINPYSSPGSDDSGRKDVGRVLSGGVVTDPAALEIALDNPSHPRAASIQSAINSRFAPGPGDEATARGKSASAVAVRVPKAWITRPEEFLRLIENIRIDSAFPEEFAKRYTEELIRQPVIAEELHWCLRSIGRPSLPFVRPLYDSAELVPRWAAVRVGAALGDVTVSPQLAAIAKGQGGEPMQLRSEAARLMGRITADPRLASVLRELVSSGPLELRAAAYQALLDRGDPSITRIVVGSGVNRFLLDMVPASEPMIYSIQTEKPRIVLFGEGTRLSRPISAEMWDGRLLVATDPSIPTAGPKDPANTTARVMFRDWRTEKPMQGRADDSLRGFIRYLAQSPSPENPEPGLGLTYSEVVGVLYQLQNQRAVAAAFATDEDKLAAEITVASGRVYIEPRPESEADRDRIEKEREAMADRVGPTPTAPAGTPQDKPEQKPRLVPVQPTVTPPTGSGASGGSGNP